MKTKEQTKRLAARRERKRKHVRARLHTDRPEPRLTVFRSSKNIYCQVIDDQAGRTLAAASTRDKDLRSELAGKKKSEAASEVGKLIARRAKDAGVARVRFDRGCYKYHGRVKALADAAREGGLQF